LEILAKTGALTDLLATGARLIEPDRLGTYGELYPPPSVDLGFSARTCDSEPCAPGPGAYIVSAETLAYTVAHSQLGDPRAFKRPVKVQIPRELPTEDQLVVRERRDAPGSTKKPPTVPVPPLAAPYRAAETLNVYEPNKPGTGPEPHPGELANGPWIAVCSNVNEVRQVAGRSARLVAMTKLRAVVAKHVPIGLASQFAGHGVVALVVDDAGLKALKASKDVQLPAPAALAAPGASVIAGKVKVNVTWLAMATERGWLAGPPTSTGPASATMKAAAKK
jgi:aconitate hydratase